MASQLLFRHTRPKRDGLFLSPRRRRSARHARGNLGIAVRKGGTVRFSGVDGVGAGVHLAVTASLLGRLTVDKGVAVAAEGPVRIVGIFNRLGLLVVVSCLPFVIKRCLSAC